MTRCSVIIGPRILAQRIVERAGKQDEVGALLQLGALCEGAHQR